MLCFRKKWVRFLVRLIDFLTISRTCPIPQKVDKILISHFGNLGDIFLCSRALSVLQQTYPGASFSFLVNSGSRGLVKDFPHHTLDHWYLLKGKMGLCKAALHYIRARRKVLREIRAEKYDLAIDFQPFFPNGVCLLKKTGIPVRMGYTSAGFGNLLTHRWELREKYVGALHLDHLNCTSPKLFFPFPKPPFLEEVILVHMESSRKKENWEREKWIALIRKLEKPVILMGHGDPTECEAVAKATGCKNYCNRVTVWEYGAMLQQAKLLISVDSMPVHLAALWEVPTLMLLRKKTADFWIPPHSRCKALSDLSLDTIVSSACMLLS